MDERTEEEMRIEKAGWFYIGVIGGASIVGAFLYPEFSPQIIGGNIPILLIEIWIFREKKK